MTFPRQTLWPLALFLPFSPSLTQRPMNTTQTHFFLFCSFSSLLLCLLFLTFPCRCHGCVLHHYVCRQRRSKVTHIHRPCVSSQGGGGASIEERGGEKKKRKRGEKKKSKEASLSNHRTVITVAAAGSKPDFRCALRHWRGLLYTRH